MPLKYQIIRKIFLGSCLSWQSLLIARCLKYRGYMRSYLSSFLCYFYESRWKVLWGGMLNFFLLTWGVVIPCRSILLIGGGDCIMVSSIDLVVCVEGGFGLLSIAYVLIGGSFGKGGILSVSGWSVFWRFLVQFVSLVLVFPVVWVCIVIVMFWLFSVSVCRMGDIYFGMEVHVLIHFLLMLSSDRVKCGSRDVFGIYIQELLYVGYFWGSRDWVSGFISVLGLVQVSLV